MGSPPTSSTTYTNSITFAASSIPSFNAVLPAHCRWRCGLLQPSVPLTAPSDTPSMSHTLHLRLVVRMLRRILTACAISAHALQRHEHYNSAAEAVPAPEQVSRTLLTVEQSYLCPSAGLASLIDPACTREPLTGGWLHGVFVGEWLFVFPLCGFSLSVFCNYLRVPATRCRYAQAPGQSREKYIGSSCFAQSHDGECDNPTTKRLHRMSKNSKV